VRKIYETEEDRKNERRIVEEVLMEGEKALKMGYKHQIDFLVVDQQWRGKSVIEVKKRKGTFGKYPDVMLSLLKWNKGIEFKRNNRLDFLFVVEWDDGIFMHRYEDLIHYTIGIGGRTDRDDAQDIEPVVYVPNKKFTQMA